MDLAEGQSAAILLPGRSSSPRLLGEGRNLTGNSCRREKFCLEKCCANPQKCQEKLWTPILKGWGIFWTKKSRQPILQGKPIRIHIKSMRFPQTTHSKLVKSKTQNKTKQKTYSFILDDQYKSFGTKQYISKIGRPLEEIGFCFNLPGKNPGWIQSGGKNPGQNFLQNFSHNNFSRSSSPPAPGMQPVGLVIHWLGAPYNHHSTLQAKAPSAQNAPTTGGLPTTSMPNLRQA